jgi:hypothetical protein
MLKEHGLLDPELLQNILLFYENDYVFHILNDLELILIGLSVKLRLL